MPGPTRLSAGVTLLLAATIAVFLGGGRADAAKHIALVIGNDAYQNQPQLMKAVGDAHAVRASLERLGFEVRLEENLGYAAMVAALASLEARIEPGDTVAFHFSGHGVAANGSNYLLPVDFPKPAGGAQGEAMLPRLAFDAGEIVNALKGRGAALTLAFLDACRDNPLSDGTRSVGLSRGLVRLDPPRGVFVMFSAGPGELARDRLTDSDPSSTSVFTRVFLPILETPGLTLVEIAKRTQVEVSELAATVDHQQFPDYSDRVIGDVVLLPDAAEATVAGIATDPEASTAADAGERAELPTSNADTPPAPPPKEVEAPTPVRPEPAEQQLAALEQPGIELVEQRAIFYHQGQADAPGRATEGTVTWEAVTKDGGAAILATLTFVDPALTATMTIARNSDPALPASHMVEIEFLRSSTQSLQRVPALVLKQTEQARGQPLEGAATAVTEMLFWIALSDDATLADQNMQLLREGSWFDIPILFNDETRALLTFEKGIPGDRVFETVMASWTSTTNESAVDESQESPSEFRTLPNGAVVKVR